MWLSLCVGTTVGWEPDLCTSSTNALCGRSLAILKLPRSGSSWLADQLKTSEEFCWFQAEVSNDLKLNHTAACDEAARVPSCDGATGFTWNPFKFSSKLATCNEQIREHIQNSMAVAVLVRENFVAEAVSALVSEDINRTNLIQKHIEKPPEGCDSWHLDKCGQDLPAPLKDPKISPDPQALMKKIQLEEKHINELKRVAADLSGNVPAFVVTFERMFHLASTTNVAAWLRRCAICRCDCPIQATDDPLRTNSTALRDKFSNWDQINDYFLHNSGVHYLSYFYER